MAKDIFKPLGGNGENIMTNNNGKIPLHHQILIMQGGRVLSGPQMSKQPFEIIGFGDVVVIHQS